MSPKKANKNEHHDLPQLSLVSPIVLSPKRPRSEQEPAKRTAKDPALWTTESLRCDRCGGGGDHPLWLGQGGHGSSRPAEAEDGAVSEIGEYKKPKVSMIKNWGHRHFRKALDTCLATTIYKLGTQRKQGLFVTIHVLL